MPKRTRNPYHHAPSNPIYEARTEDWARRAIARMLGVYTMSRRKNTQWHDIVRMLANKLDHYKHLQERANADSL